MAKAGSLPWEGDDRHVVFGDCDTRALEIASERILTFTEQVSDAVLLRNIKRSVVRAERIVFLGFGFHRQNLEILECDCRPDVEILATSLGISKTDCGSIEQELETRFGLSDNEVLINHKYSRLFPLECAPFIREVWRTLTAEPAADPRTNFDEIFASRHAL